MNYMRVKDTRRICGIIYSAITLHNMQNRHHRGSYAYDPVVNRIANQNPNDYEPENENVVDGVEPQPNAIERQRNLILYFDAIVVANVVND